MPRALPAVTEGEGGGALKNWPPPPPPPPPPGVEFILRKLRADFRTDPGETLALGDGDGDGGGAGLAIGLERAILCALELGEFFESLNPTPPPPPLLPEVPLPPAAAADVTVETASRPAFESIRSIFWARSTVACAVPRAPPGLASGWVAPRSMDAVCESPWPIDLRIECQGSGAAAVAAAGADVEAEEEGEVRLRPRAWASAAAAAAVALRTMAPFSSTRSRKRARVQSSTSSVRSGAGGRRTMGSTPHSDSSRSPPSGSRVRVSRWGGGAGGCLEAGRAGGGRLRVTSVSFLCYI